MKVLLDTSTLLAAKLPDHVHDAQANAWLSQAKAGAFEFVVSSHSIAEAYSVLTRLPRKPRISGAEAWKMLQGNVIPFAQAIALSSAAYAELIEDLSRREIVGGLTYDAII